MSLLNKKCVPCEGGIVPLDKSGVDKYINEIDNDWNVLEDNKKIKKDFKFKDFVEAMKFVNQVADLAEEEGHHPDIFISYNKVEICLWTHAIGGLHENDFILAAKIDNIKK